MSDIFDDIERAWEALKESGYEPPTHPCLDPTCRAFGPWAALIAHMRAAHPGLIEGVLDRIRQANA
jgi:hypothetical protein